MNNLNTLQGMTSIPAHAEPARTHDHANLLKRVCALAMLAMLSSYALQLMNSAGDISVQEKNVIFVVSALTLLVIISIIALNVYFVSRHRALNTTAEHCLPRSHLIREEAAAWSIPIVIVVLLALFGWGISHSLDVHKTIESKAAPVRVATVAGA